METEGRSVKDFKKRSLTPQTKERHLSFSEQTGCGGLHTAIRADYVCWSQVINAELQIYSEMFCAKPPWVICVCHVGFFSSMFRILCHLCTSVLCRHLCIISLAYPLLSFHVHWNEKKSLKCLFFCSSLK